MIDDNFDNVMKMAKNIILNIGKVVTTEDGDTTKYNGLRYDYDRLRICYDDSDKDNIVLSIYLDKTLVLSYNYANHKIFYKNGKWTELIKLIYDNVPSIIEDRDSTKINEKIKEEELLSLESYFKYIVRIHKNLGIFNFLNNSLSNHGITIRRIERYKSRRDLSQNNSLFYPYYIYLISSRGLQVAEFYEDKHNVFPDIDYYIDKFIPGDWVNEFKNVVNHTKVVGEKIMQDQLDDDADHIMDSFIRRYKI